MDDTPEEAAARAQPLSAACPPPTTTHRAAAPRANGTLVRKRTSAWAPRAAGGCWTCDQPPMCSVEGTRPWRQRELGRRHDRHPRGHAGPTGPLQVTVYGWSASIEQREQSIDGRGNASSRRTSGQGVDGRPRRGTERGAQGCVVAFVAPRARQVLRARKRDSLCAAARGHATPARAPALGRGRVAACPVPLMGVCMVAQGRGRAASASPSPGGAAQGGAGTGAGLLSSVMTRLGFLSAGCLPGHLRARTRACTHGAHGCLEKNASKRVFGHAPTLLTLSSRLGQCFVRTRWQASVRP